MIWVRHGETAPNRDGVLLGRADPDLTDRGRRQADAIAAVLGDAGATAIVSSPLRRARQTADAIAAVTDLEVVVDNRLVEIDYGEWEGRRLADIGPEESERWRANPDFAPVGGESVLAVSTRVAGWCRDYRDSPPVIAVSHVSPIKGAVAWALGVTAATAWRMWLAPASITRIAVRDGRGVLMSFNELAHLADVEG